MQGTKLRRILWFSWKDLSHPEAGGAELINEEIAKRLARDGHEVMFLVAGFPGSEVEKIRNGYKVIRLGNRYAVYWHAYRYYKKRLRGWADLVIDEMNALPFFCKYYVRERNILLAYQLCREIWFYQVRFPLSLIGYLLEPVYLWLLRDRCVITESESTKRDMQKYGFSAGNISVIPVGIATKPLENLDGTVKFARPTVLSLGSVRPMKRTLDQIEAFEIAKKTIPDLQLKIAGDASGSYGKNVLARIAASDCAQDIEHLGRVDEGVKTELMRKCHLILVTSVKEGWGLIVTEANSQGTPAAVYDVDGLRDSTVDGKTGIIARENTPRGLADAIVAILGDRSRYSNVREDAWKASREFTFEKTYSAFAQAIEKA